jgi:predicted secreted protein
MSLAASLAVATPAMAQSTVKDSGVRLDVHGGLGWHDGQSVQGTIGATIGYDINTPYGTFLGVEKSVDKLLTG